MYDNDEKRIKTMIEALQHPHGEEFPGAFDGYRNALRNEFEMDEKEAKSLGISLKNTGLGGPG